MTVWLRAILQAILLEPSLVSGLALVQRHDRSISGQEPWEYQCSSDGMGGPVSMWRAVSQQSGLPNLCSEGKSLPQLYVLGAPKCGSTSIAIDATKAGIQCAGNVKEYNFWGKAEIKDFLKNKTKVMESWLSGMPDCEHDSRLLVGDFSPKYLSIVPGTGAEPWHPPATVPNLPPVLRAAYGEQADKITFLLMIREPLSRVHSHWHYSGPNSRGNTFSSEVQAWMNDTKSDFRMTTRVWYSSYASQMEQWLKSFSPAQFMVIPYKAYSDNGGLAVCGELSERLGFKMQCAAETAHGMASKHASLDEELSPEVQVLFRTMVARERERLVKLLADGHAKGMSLPRYSGAKGSEQEIEQWLDEWW